MSFTDLPDLASEDFGGAAILCNDEFFAEKENLLKPHEAVWKEHEYTDRGKWMDGWETRRYRPANGIAPARDSDIHDWCVIRLGLPGVIKGVVVDTAFFRGNYPDSCELQGTTIEEPLDLAALGTATWTPIIRRANLEGNTKNTFDVKDDTRYTHVRLVIYPDGGVARLRIHGQPVADWNRLRSLGGPIDLAALENGAVVESCSDMFFGSRTNLIKPNASLSMADGWETRRRRGEGHDWAIVRLAAQGTIERIELDTSHFKGNAPARFSVEGKLGEDGVWRELLGSRPAQAHRRHVFDRVLRRLGPITHLRVSTYPCGGIARLRALGTLTPTAEAGINALNALSAADASAAMLKVCGSTTWAAAMTALRPFEDRASLLRLGERYWWQLDEAAHREAFAAHPKIGQSSASKWSADEQRGVAAADSDLMSSMAELNRQYEAKHGFIYIICASGLSAPEMHAQLQARLANDTATELLTASEEQAKIIQLRLQKLIAEV